MARRSAPEAAAQRVWKTTRRVFSDPRAVGVAQAFPRTVGFMARQHRLHRDAGPSGDVPGATVGLAAQVLLDEIVISAMRQPGLMPHGEDYRRAGDDMRTAHRMWQEHGWLEHPEQYHRTPPLPQVSWWSERSVDHVTFPSSFEPHPGEPGATRWMARRANHTAHAFMLRHRGPARPWLVCVHGFGMGRSATDVRAFRARKLHRELGINVLLPVLPLHGPRQEPGTRMGEGFMSVDLIDSVHGLTQSAWDIRAAIRWIRAEEGDVPIGLYGISLGGYVTALTASLEEGLACAIAGIPAVDLPGLYRRHSPPQVRRRALEAGALGPQADAVHSVVSPLVLTPKLPKDRRFVFAGVGDRMSTSGQARRLWEHWDRPAVAWYPGGHVGFFLAANVTEFVTNALVNSGVVRAGLPATTRA